MYKIYLQDGQDWLFVENSNASLKDSLLRIMELDEQYPSNVYRLEEVSESGIAVINFK